MVPAPATGPAHEPPGSTDHAAGPDLAGRGRPGPAFGNAVVTATEAEARAVWEAGFAGTAKDVARQAGRGVDRLVVGPSDTKVTEQRDQLSAFAVRLGLR